MPPKPKSPPAVSTSAQPAAVAPAPHNGTAYGERRPIRRTEAGLRQLSQRIPEELFTRLANCTADTGVSQRRLLLDALDSELTRRGF